MKNTIFSGTATALITPFSSDGKNVDFNAFQRLIDFQLENSIDALVVAGTTGESSVLTREEKISLIRSAKSSCGSAIPVIAGTGSNNTVEAVKKSNDAEKEGVNGLLIVTPYYNKCNQDGIINHYFYIADRVSTPIIVYNVPSRTGVTINSETYKALSEHKNIVAVKEASGNISEFNKSIESAPDLVFYSGNDDQTVSMMVYGAKGLISVTSNIIPGIIKRISDYCLEGEYIKASELHKKYLKLMNVMFCDVNPIPIKSACNKLLCINKTVRLPLTAIRENDEQMISEILTEYNLI